MKFDEIIDSIGWRASIGWLWEAVLRCRFSFFFFFVATVRRFGCGGYTPVLRGVFLSAFSGTGAGRGEILSFSAETGAYLKGAS